MSEQKPYYKVYRPTGEMHELADSTVNGWDCTNAAD